MNFTLTSWCAVFLVLPFLTEASESHACNTFEPFRMAPENSKFHIGGPFALHEENCKTIKRDVVQELVAVQWSLSHWNQNPENADSRVAMFAGDFCSREKEAVLQTVKFLDETGYFVPAECGRRPHQALPLGLISPSMANYAASLSDVINAFGVPTVAYTMSSAEILRKRSAANLVFSTTPSLKSYFELTSHLLKAIGSNYVTVLHDATSAYQRLAMKQMLNSAGIIVEAFRSVDELNLSTADVFNQLNAAQSNVIVTIMEKQSLENLFLGQNLGSLEGKIWLMIPTTEALLDSRHWDFIAAFTIHSVAIALKPRITEMTPFKTYFLDILRSNYQSYPLLAAYMQQIFNCTVESSSSPPLVNDTRPCSVYSTEELSDAFVQSPNIQPIVLATYALAVLGKQLTGLSQQCEQLKNDKQNCSVAADALIQQLRQMKYTFTDSDPSSLKGRLLAFNDNGEIQSSIIEAFQIYGESQSTKINKVADYKIGGALNVYTQAFLWPNGEIIESNCSLANSNNCEACSKLRSAPENYILHKPGDIYVAGMFGLHSGLSSNGNQQCGFQKTDIVSATLPLSYIYGLETIKQRYRDLNLLPNVELGLVMFDTCENTFSAIREFLESEEKCTNAQRFDLTTSQKQNHTVRPDRILSYAFGLPEGRMIDVFASKSAARKPLISSTWSTLSATSNYDLHYLTTASSHAFTLMPDLLSQAEAVVEVLKQFGWNYVSILLSRQDEECVQAFEAFKLIAEMSDVCIADIISSDSIAASATDVSATSVPSTRVLILFARASDASLYIHISSNNAAAKVRPAYIFTGEAHDLLLEETLRHQAGALLGSLSVVPKSIVTNDFIDFLDALTPELFPEPWFLDFWEAHFQCSLPNRRDRKQRAAASTKECSDERFVAKRLGQLTREGYLLASLEYLVFSIDAVYKQRCPEQKGLCEAFFSNYMNDLSLARLQAEAIRSKMFNVYNVRRMENNKTVVAKLIGNWTEENGLEFDSGSYAWYENNGEQSITHPLAKCSPETCKCKMLNNKNFFSKPLQQQQDERGSFASGSSDQDDESNSKVRIVAATQLDDWRNRSWSYIFLGINSFLILAAVAVLVLVIFKLCVGVVKGNQSLGICLLCGCIALYVTAFFFIFDPSENICRLRYFFHSLSYAFCFGVMIAKAIQLRNSETIGYQGYISYWNYWLLLFFIVGVQVALNLQWALVKNPVVVNLVEVGATLDTIVVKTCNWSFEELLISQTYVAFLLVLLLFVSTVTRNVKRNYKETKWLMYTAVVCVPVWLVWMLAFAYLPAQFRDTVIVMELIVCATIILSFMFGPKLYILLSYEPVLVEVPSSYKLDEGFMEPITEYIKAALDRKDSHSVASTKSTKSSILSKSSTPTTADSLSEHGSEAAAPVYVTAVVKKKSRKHNGASRQLPVDEHLSNSIPEEPCVPFSVQPSSDVFRNNPMFAMRYKC